MNIGRVEDQPLGRLGDGDDAVEWMFAVLGRFLIARQADDLVLVLVRE
jgi:hypothetical protein